jgi:hypothetical protein
LLGSVRGLRLRCIGEPVCAVFCAAGERQSHKGESCGGAGGGAMAPAGRGNRHWVQSIQIAATNGPEERGKRGHLLDEMHVAGWYSSKRTGLRARPQ